MRLLQVGETPDLFEDLAVDQYLAGVGLNQYTEAKIYEEIAKLRRSPDNLFVADSAFKRQLLDAMR